MNSRILEAVYQRLLKKSAPSVTDLAVTIEVLGAQSSATVYSPSSLTRVFESGAYPTFATGSVKNYRALQKFDVIRGYVMIDRPDMPCNNAYEVKMSAGPGIGKVIYGVAFALSPSGILIPDRMSVSSLAQRGWSAQVDRRKKKPLDDGEHPAKGADPFHDAHHTKKSTDDCDTHTGLDFLNYSYESEGWEPGLLRTMKKNHKAMMAWIDANADVPSADVEAAIMYYGPDFFEEKYPRE